MLMKARELLEYEAWLPKGYRTLQMLDATKKLHFWFDPK